MGSRRSRKAKARETLAYQLQEAVKPTVFGQDKDSDNQRNVQNPCSKCPNWTRCVGYQQYQECKRKGGQYE